MQFTLAIDSAAIYSRDPRPHLQVYSRTSPSMWERSTRILLSRQTYIEAFHIFYRINNPYFKSTDRMYRFLRNIGYARRQHVTVIESYWKGRDSKRAFRLLKTCQGLKVLKTMITDNQPNGYVALREVRGLEKVSINYGPPDKNYHLNPSSYHDPQELKQAMMRPRLKYYAANPDEKLNLFKRRREVLR